MSLLASSLPGARSPIERWALDPRIVHLNHGSYGGCPRRVLDAAAAVRARLEAAPMRFFGLEWQAELDRARSGLAAFVGARPDRLVFVPGATTGVAIALASLLPTLEAGDGILVTDHGYRACTNQVRRLAAARGLAVTTARVALPFDDDALVEAVWSSITPRTRVAVLDHVTSPTALVLPIARLVALLAERDVATIVDGAHAPGQLELAVDALGATYYAGNCHKWLCAPKGSGFLVVADGAPNEPLVTSHGASPEYGPANRLHAEFDWPGTHDPAAYLAVPAAIDAVAAEGGGWPAVVARNHALIIAMRERLVAALGGPRRPIAPDDALGSMASIPIELPAGVEPLGLEHELLRDGWEVPIVEFATGPMVRISAQLYNHAGEVDNLARELHLRGVRTRELVVG